MLDLAGSRRWAGSKYPPPNMATLPGTLCTDASISPSTLHRLLTSAIGQIFQKHLPSTGTCPQTTPSLSSPTGPQADSIKPTTLPPPPSSSSQSQDHTTFLKTLTAFVGNLSKLVVRNCEGATKLVIVHVRRQRFIPSRQTKLASTIARCPPAPLSLFKVALYERDANRSRILTTYAPMGYTFDRLPTIPKARGGSSLFPEATSVSFDPPPIMGW